MCTIGRLGRTHTFLVVPQYFAMNIEFRESSKAINEHNQLVDLVERKMKLVERLLATM